MKAALYRVNAILASLIGAIGSTSAVFPLSDPG